MNYLAYEQLVSSESRARHYVLGFCFKNQQRFCPRCRSRKLLRLADGRRRCSGCRYSFRSDFAGRWIASGRLSPAMWLRIIKLFELELSTRKIARQLGLSYPTAYKAVRTIRLAILAHAPDADRLLSGEIELDESYFGGKRKGKRGRGAGGKVPVFGILERGGKVVVEVVPNVTARTLVGLTEKVVRRGAIVYTDKWKAYDTLMCCGYRHLQIDHEKRFANGKVYINGLEGFWSFAKERLIKHHGVSPEHFPLYLKELEFRYNHRNESLFPILVRFVAGLVPNHC
jgi:transposase